MNGLRSLGSKSGGWDLPPTFPLPISPPNTPSQSGGLWITQGFLRLQPSCQWSQVEQARESPGLGQQPWDASGGHTWQVHEGDLCVSKPAAGRASIQATSLLKQRRHGSLETSPSKPFPPQGPPAGQGWGQNATGPCPWARTRAAPCWAVLGLRLRLARAVGLRVLVRVHVAECGGVRPPRSTSISESESGSLLAPSPQSPWSPFSLLPPPLHTSL